MCWAVQVFTRSVAVKLGRAKEVNYQPGNSRNHWYRCVGVKGWLIPMLDLLQIETIWFKDISFWDSLIFCDIFLFGAWIPVVQSGAWFRAPSLCWPGTSTPLENSCCSWLLEPQTQRYSEHLREIRALRLSVTSNLAPWWTQSWHSENLGSKRSRSSRRNFSATNSPFRVVEPCLYSLEWTWMNCAGHSRATHLGPQPRHPQFGAAYPCARLSTKTWAHSWGFQYAVCAIYVYI